MPAKNTNLSKIVVDASVIMSLLMPDERSHLSASFAHFLNQNGPQLFAPQLLIYEVTNALHMAVVRNRISYHDAIECLIGLKILSIFQVQLDNPIQLIEIAHQLDISSYDAAYVTLARDQSAPLYTLDTKLQKKVKGYVDILDLGELSSLRTYLSRQQR